MARTGSIEEPLGTILDYFTFESDSSDRVRIKGFYAASANPKKNPGLVYLILVEGDAQKEEDLPEELRDLSVARYKQLLDEERLKIISTPRPGD